MLTRLILFLILNFGTLALGGLFTDIGEWYLSLNRAPWTPPGWFFGVAWSVIMICFSFYMAYLWSNIENRKTLVILFIFQFILNVGWNPIFFYYKNVALGLVVIIALMILIGYILNRYKNVLKIKSALLLPYLVWLIVATSLNAYVLLNN